MCVLRHLSCAWLFVTLWTVTHQALLSMGFSRQEYWSGLPCPPPGDLPNPEIEPRSSVLQADSFPSEPQGKLCIYIYDSESLSVVSDLLWPHGLYLPWNSPGQNTGVDSHSLLQGIFPTQGLNPGLPPCRRILYQLRHKGTPCRGKNNSNDPDFSSEIMDTNIQKEVNIQNIQKKICTTQ